MKEIKLTIETVLKGVGQIMLQDSAWTGLLFLIAIFVDSVLMGVFALLSSTIGTATAKVFKFSEANIHAGLYGFNATLIGVGLVFFFELNAVVWIAIIAGSIISTLLMEFSIRKKLPFFTFPFIVVTVVAVLLIKNFSLATLRVPDPSTVIEILSDFTVGAHGYSEIIFQGSILAGMLFFLGVFVKNPTAALYGFMAALVASAIAQYHENSMSLISDGMFSFNAVLCAIVCSGTKPRDGIYVLLSVVIATYFDIFMMNNGFITLTFPFVLAMWIIIPLKKLMGNYEDKVKSRNRKKLLENKE